MENIVNLLERHRIETGSLQTLFETEGGKIYSLSIPGAEAVNFWYKLRANSPQIGFYPVILGGQAELGRILQTGCLVQKHYSGSVLEGAAHNNGSQRLKGRPDHKVEKEVEKNQNVPEIQLSSEWLKQNFIIHLDPYNARPLEKVYLALVPVRQSWEVPSKLQFRRVEGSPSLREYSRVLQRWNELYRAEIVGMSSNLLEMVVPEPPSTLPDAFELAREHLAYRSKVLAGQKETIEALAADLLDCKIWHFWWN